MFISAFISITHKNISFSQQIACYAEQLQMHFGCHAIGLLKYENESLIPLHFIGLMPEAQGRKFNINQHPRLAAILNSKHPVHFASDCVLPDPYDGLFPDKPDRTPLVHDCLGVALYFEEQCWGVLTLDALIPSTFTEKSLQDISQCRDLIEIAISRYQYQLKCHELEAKLKNLPAMLDPLMPLNAPAIIGHSEAITSVLKELKTVAQSNLPVLLLGETGVGKELFARQLQQWSSRAKFPFIYINCAALPEQLIETELFGHEKGAFSGATQARKGKFEAANKGTLFLDEVGEIPLSAQAKLLRVLQNGEIQRVGCDESKHVDVRIIAATNRNLQSYVHLGKFRADLYHRLSVYPLSIPPLKERSSDIPLLAGYFLEQNKHRLMLRGLRLTEIATQLLISYHWPGNVRELEHVISRASLKALMRQENKHNIITIDFIDLDIPLPHQEPPITALHSQSEPEEHDIKLLPLTEAVQQFQRQYINRALNATQYNWSKAAKKLAIDASNLHKLASRLGLK